jgi:immunoglobulin-binding protein 1
MNLRTHFEAANRINNEVNDSPLPSTDEELLGQVADGLAHLRACEKLIAELGVFSVNETKDDINPSDLKYLLVPYLLAELTLKQVDHDRRPAHLRAAKLQLEAFVEALSRTELITSAECSELLAEGVGSGGLGGMASKREQRIARIRAERAARAQMEAVEAKLAAARGRSSADADDRDDDIDNLEREHTLQWLHVAKYGAVDTLDSIGQELPMLEEVERLRRDDPAFDESLRNPPPVERPAEATGRGLESFHIPHSSRQDAYERVRAQHTPRARRIAHLTVARAR